MEILEKNLVVKIDDGEIEFENIGKRAWVVLNESNQKDVLERMKLFGDVFRGATGFTVNGEPLSRKHFDEQELPIAFFRRAEAGFWLALNAEISGAAAKNE